MTARCTAAFWRSFWLTVLVGSAIALGICAFVALSVEVRGCNPFLDHSDLGVPKCGGWQS